MLKMDGATVSMIRTGAYPSELLFAEDQRHVGLYQTDFGALTISTHTRRLENTIGADGGQLADRVYGGSGQLHGWRAPIPHDRRTGGRRQRFRLTECVKR